MDCSPPAYSAHGALQSRILVWVVMHTPENLPHPGIEPGSPVSPALAAGFFTTEPPGKPALLMGFPGGSGGKDCLQCRRSRYIKLLNLFWISHSNKNNPKPLSWRLPFGPCGFLRPWVVFSPTSGTQLEF